MCDASQPFGVDILILSMKSAKIRSAVLALADASMHKDRISQLQKLADYNTGANGKREPMENAVLNVFRILREVVIDLTGFWRQQEEATHGEHLLGSILLLSQSVSSVAPSIYWVLVRLSKCTNYQVLHN
jgi:hypothetical protein